ncbi:MAG: tetratricopeptide repeat protein, partial [Anaerolineae bacterium]
LDKAARKAQAEYANETALPYYNRALALEEHREWRREQIEILHILGRREEEAASLKILAANPQANPVETALLWGRYYESTASYAEAQATVEQALLAGHQTGRMVDRIRCLNQLGLIARRRGDYDDATVWYNQVVNLFQDAAGYAADEGQVLAQALNGLGIVHRQQGRFDEARTCYERALDLYRAAQNRRGEAETLNSLGVTAFYQRAFEAALAYHQEALSIRQTIGDRAGEGISLLNLAQATRDAGDYGQAQQYLRAALNIQQAVGNRWEQVVIWNDMGILFQELGDLPRAESCLQQGLDLCHEIGHKVGITYLMSNLALVMRDGMKLPEAERLLVEGLALVQQQTKDDKYQSAVFLSYLSTVNLQSGKLKKAIQQAEKALAMRRETGLHLLAADDLATLAAAHLKANDVVSAVSYAEKSLAILQECDGQGPEFPQRDYFVCYRVMTAAGQTQTARAALQAACKLVMDRADKIIDPALRQSFLQKVAINRQIVAAAAQAGQS